MELSSKSGIIISSRRFCCYLSLFWKQNLGVAVIKRHKNRTASFAVCPSAKMRLVTTQLSFLSCLERVSLSQNDNGVPPAHSGNHPFVKTHACFGCGFPRMHTSGDLPCAASV